MAAIKGGGTVPDVVLPQAASTGATSGGKGGGDTASAAGSLSGLAAGATPYGAAAQLGGEALKNAKGGDGGSAYGGEQYQEGSSIVPTINIGAYKKDDTNYLLYAGVAVGVGAVYLIAKKKNLI